METKTAGDKAASLIYRLFGKGTKKREDKAIDKAERRLRKASAKARKELTENGFSKEFVDQYCASIESHIPQKSNR